MSHEPAARKQSPIAIVAASALFPGRSGIGGFWQDILEGRDLIRPIPPHYWRIDDYYDPDPKAADRTYGKTGAFLEPFKFNPIEFGLPPAQLPATDTAQIMAMVLARSVLDQALAAVGEEGLRRDRISVILGVASATELVIHLGARLQRPIWEKAMREAGLSHDQIQNISARISAHYVPWQEGSFPGLLGNVVAGRVANRFNLGGSNYVTDAACASSLAAVLAGVNELNLGQADSVLCGGIDAINDIFMYMCFSKTPALSPTGHARPFSATADGTILGEGGGMMMLRRLEDAERDGNSILALLTGVGHGSDGKGTAIYAPKAEGQAAALRRAYQYSGFGPGDVELVEAHGTATNAGDAAELNALQMVYGQPIEGGGAWCALGSVKSQIGHTKAAAGMAGMLKAALALHHKVLPPTIKVDAPNKALKDNSAFYLSTERRPWISRTDRPRRAAVSSFGFGGSNFHATLEEYRGPARVPERLRTQSHELFLFSGPDAPAVATALANAVEILSRPYDSFKLAADQEWMLRERARASQQSFDPAHAVRVALVAGVTKGIGETARKVLQALRTPGVRRLQGPSFAIEAGEVSPGRVAFLFPGQGSQSVGMTSNLAMELEPARAVWDRAASYAYFRNMPLHHYVFPPPTRDQALRAAQEAVLADQRVVQPALAVASLAYLRVLESVGIRADCVAGHSFGQLSALCAAGVLSEEDYLRAAADRGRTMFEAGLNSEGGMTAVAAPIATVQALIGQTGAGLSLANDNGPQQVVVSGPLVALEQLEFLAAAQGMTAKRLAVSTALHSPMMASACDPFSQALSTLQFRIAEIPVYASDSALPFPAERESIRLQLGASLAQTVRFREMVESMAQDGVTTFVEVGPRATLTALAKSCLGEENYRFIALDGRDNEGLEALLLGLGRLAVAGCKPDLEVFWRTAPLGAAPVVAGPMTVAVGGTNIGKPYPSAEFSSEQAPVQLE